MPRARWALAFAVAGLALPWGPVALAQTSPGPSTSANPPISSSPQASGEPRDQVVLSGDVIVHRGEEVGEVIVLHGAVSVAGVVRGDVVVIDGRIEVAGQVSGSVVSISGPVTVGANAQVLGDVIGRDRIRVADGARIGGRVRQGTAFTFRTPIDLFGPLAAWLAVAASTLVLGALLVLLAPRGMDAAAAAALGSPLASGGIGLAVLIGLPLLGVLALVSLVGLPLGLGLLLALAFLYSVGFALGVYTVGRILWRAPRSRWLALLFGWALVAALSAIPYTGGVIWLLGAIAGIGAATVAAWRARGAGGRHRPGGKMPPEHVVDVRDEAMAGPMITERAMGEEGAGI
jgi:hypothetical protein